MVGGRSIPIFTVNMVSIKFSGIVRMELFLRTSRKKKFKKFPQVSLPNRAALRGKNLLPEEQFLF